MKEWYPEIRKKILHSIWALSNKEYQREGWLQQNNLPSGYGFDNFDEAVYWLFDVLYGDENVDGSIGSCLIDERESKLVKRLLNALDAVLEDVGTEQSTGRNQIPDDEYLNSPKWDNVVEAASKAWEVMKDKVYPPK